ncbi:hypothetical protein ASE67_11410 [Sphingomonas sp. Leaf23]|nr:hypothetical protein ASE67_11410 [Sphingomonas sp. Leaf23]
MIEQHPKCAALIRDDEFALERIANPIRMKRHKPPVKLFELECNRLLFTTCRRYVRYKHTLSDGGVPVDTLILPVPIEAEGRNDRLHNNENVGISLDCRDLLRVEWHELYSGCHGLSPMS